MNILSVCIKALRNRHPWRAAKLFASNVLLSRFSADIAPVHLFRLVNMCPMQVLLIPAEDAATGVHVAALGLLRLWILPVPAVVAQVPAPKIRLP